MNTPNLSNLNADVLSYIATSLDKRSLFNLMAACHHCYTSIDRRIIDALFHKEGKSFCFVNDVSFFRLRERIKKWQTLHEDIKWYQDNYDFRYPSKWSQFCDQVFFKVKLTNFKMVMRRNYLKTCRERDRMKGSIGDNYLELALGPALYNNIPEIQNLPNSDYHFSKNRLFSDITNFNQLFGYRSSKHLIVRGNLNGKKFVILRTKHAKETKQFSIILSQDNPPYWMVRNSLGLRDRYFGLLLGHNRDDIYQMVQNISHES